MQNDLLNAEQLARQLGVKPRTVMQWLRDGLIPAKRLTPKVIRYNLNEVVAALQEREAVKGGEHGKY